MAVRFKLAQDGTCRGSSYVGHIGEIFVVHVDFDLVTILWTDATAIREAEQDRHKALDVVAFHQIVRPANGQIEMCNRYKTEKPPS
jgi:hypothetical protein